MPERISTSEQKLATRLAHAGLDRPEALCAILMTTRQYARPRSDLLSTLQHYPQLEVRAVVDGAITRLLHRGLLMEETNYDGGAIVAPDADIRSRIAALIGDPSIESELLDLRRVNDDYVTVIGPLRDRAAYDSYLDFLRNAQTQILMPMVMTDPEGLEAVSLLIERANAGVQVLILGASPRLVQKFRGTAARGAALSRIAAWKRLARTHRNIRYRLSEHESDLIYATSTMVDDALVRIVVHDPFEERSKEGLVLEIGSIDGKRLNIIRDFEARFREAWHRGRSPDRWGLALWALSTFWQLALGVLLGFAALPIALPIKSLTAVTGPELQPTMFSILTSVAASLLFAAVVDFITRVRRLRNPVDTR